MSDVPVLRELAVRELQVRSFRNIARADLVFGERFNVLSGDNGQGKTNLLEALYTVATSRSFRATRPGELVQHDGEVASVRASVEESGDLREQQVGLRAGARQVKIDGKRPSTLADYAVRTPAVIFHPGEVSLSMGAGSERRRLLDRLSLYLDPSSMAELESYGRALRSRQKTLETRGTSAPELGEWEALAVRHGLAVMRARARAAEPLGRMATLAFARIGAPDLTLDIRYAPGAPVDEDTYLAALAARRESDRHRGSAHVGPHRDDLSLLLDGRPVRGVASQGQHRAIVLSLKSAEVQVVGESRGVHPLLLLDDVSSELDPARTEALFSFLRDQAGQIFLTTTRKELIATGSTASRVDFRVQNGTLERTS